eukprot:TRINITY_DN77738_c0_g1_i1.p5 TRINITY_DN77738_c0_g1~~TRINITY_DN77738_c0_g1_i1.p5  ORF type:complete len:110 (-),score=2.37 TRINITY_DN77738_c0_g1_i1:8-337(-)
MALPPFPSSRALPFPSGPSLPPGPSSDHFDSVFWLGRAWYDGDEEDALRAAPSSPSWCGCHRHRSALFDPRCVRSIVMLHFSTTRPRPAVAGCDGNGRGGCQPPGPTIP